MNMILLFILFLNINDPFIKGEIYYFQKKYSLALSFLGKAKQKYPEKRKIYSYLGDIYLLKKECKKAIENYEKAIELNENFVDLYRMAKAYYCINDGDNALKYYQKALNKNPKAYFVHFEKGLTYLLLKRDKKGVIREWEAFISKAPKDPQTPKIRKILAIMKKKDFVIPKDISKQELLKRLKILGLKIKEEKETGKLKKIETIKEKIKRKKKTIDID